MAKHKRKSRRSRETFYYYYGNGNITVMDKRAFLLDKKRKRYKPVGAWEARGPWYNKSFWIDYNWEDTKWKPLTPEMRANIPVWLPKDRWYQDEQE